MHARRRSNHQPQQPSHDYGHGQRPAPNQDWDEEGGQLLRNYQQQSRKEWSLVQIFLCLIGVLSVLGVLAVLLRSGRGGTKVPPATSPPAQTGPVSGSSRKSTPQDPKALLQPIDKQDRCGCSRCKQWSENRRKPWLKPRKENYVKGCESHLMEWHQVTSKLDGHLLPGPGRRFKMPGVICDICQKDFDLVGKTLWEKEQKHLHSWTCYKCVWADPDRFRELRDPITQEITKKHVTNYGVDICGVCAEKCPEQTRKFTDLGPEGTLLHAHPGDHLGPSSHMNLVQEMRKKVHDEL